MGWGNSTVDYGYQAPLGGVVQTRTETVVIDDSATINFLREHRDELQRDLDHTVITRRAWAILARRFASGDLKPMPENEMKEIFKKIKAACFEDVKKRGIKDFAEKADYNLSF